MLREGSEEGWKAFLELCASLSSAKHAELLFALFLTHEEKEMLRQRYLIVKALLDGEMTQREIAEMYKVSISQITRGSNALKIVDNKFKRFLKAHIK